MTWSLSLKCNDSRWGFECKHRECLRIPNHLTYATCIASTSSLEKKELHFTVTKRFSFKMYLDQSKTNLCIYLFVEEYRLQHIPFDLDSIHRNTIVFTFFCWVLDSVKCFMCYFSRFMTASFNEFSIQRLVENERNDRCYFYIFEYKWNFRMKKPYVNVNDEMLNNKIIS